MKPVTMLGDFGGASAFAQRAQLYSGWLDAKTNATDLSGTVVVMQVLHKLHTQPVTGNIVFTIFETTRLGKEQVALLNKARCVCVPTPCVAACRRSGVKVPVHAIDYGVPSAFVSDPQVVPPGLVFLTAGRIAHGVRKDMIRVIGAFLTVFNGRQDAVLQVKLSPDDAVPDIRSMYVQYITDNLQESDMVRWYRQGTVFVSPSWGEGWGLHEHEAMACGKPIISTCKTGISKLVPLNTVYRVASQPFCGYHVPDYNSLIGAMQEVVDDPQLAYVKGRLAQDFVAGFSLEAEKKAVCAVVKRYA